MRCVEPGATAGAASDVTVEVTGPWYGAAADAGDQPQPTAVVSRYSSVIDRACLSIFRGIREGRLAAVTTNVAAVLGREPISFDRWAQQNTASFV